MWEYRFSPSLVINTSALLVSLGLLTACQGQRIDEGCGNELQLQLAAVRALPKGAQPTGLLATGILSPTVLFWRDRTLTWLPPSDGAPIKAELGGFVLGAALRPGDAGATAMVFAGEGRALELLQVTSTGMIAERRNVGIAVEPIEAVLADTTWVVADEPNRHTWRLRRPDQSQDSSLFVVSRDSASEQVRQWMRVSLGAKGRVFATRRIWPFDAHEIDVTGKRLPRRLERLELAPGNSGLGLQRHWVSLPVLALQCGSLQLLADRLSDQRLIILRDNSGRVSRSRFITAPMGFVHTRPADSIIVAVRVIDGEEVALYRWTVLP